MAPTWFVGPDGTLWPTNGEHPPPKEKTFKRWDRSDKTVLDPEVRSRKGYERKLESKFISACAAALVQGTLSETNPHPPADLRREIKQLGGNTNWLRANRTRIKAFTKSAYGQGFLPDFPDEQ